MSYETPFACITNDTGLVAEMLHVSPMFVRYGAPTRGRYADRRLARARRTEARWQRRGQSADGHETMPADRFALRF
jgi:hypothetical protein